MDYFGYFTAWMILFAAIAVSIFIWKKEFSIYLPLLSFSAALFLTLKYVYDITVLPNHTFDGIPVTWTMRLFLMNDSPFVTSTEQGLINALFLLGAAAVYLVVFSTVIIRKHQKQNYTRIALHE